MEFVASAESPSKFSDQSTVPHGAIPAEQGLCAIDEDEDEDIKSHGKLLNDHLLQTYSASQAHLIAVKKRLIEEKEIALFDAERKYLNMCDKYQREINDLKSSMENQGKEMTRNQRGFGVLCENSASLLSKRHHKYSSPASLRRAFQGWADNYLDSKRSDKFDRIAKAFARKYLLAKSFLTMCLNSQKKKAGRANSEAKFKFDSVTTEMVNSYESQLQAMREDLKEAYMTIEAEQLRRQQLEEDLRRLFLKNMTTMNFEALSLFQNSHNMVESVHTKPIRSDVPSATPPRPVRRDLTTSMRSSAGKHTPASSSSLQHSERSPNSSLHHTHASAHGHSNDHHSAHSPMKVSMNGLTEEEMLIQQHIDDMMLTGELHSPSVTTPAVQALQYPHQQYTHHQYERESMEPRPPLHSGLTEYAYPSPGNTNQQLSEAYRYSMTTTSHLAHHPFPATASPPTASSSPPHTHTPAQNQSARKTTPSRSGDRDSIGGASGGKRGASTPSSVHKKPFH